MLGEPEGGQEKETGAGSGQRRWGLGHEDEAMSLWILFSFESVAHKWTVTMGTVVARAED